VRTFNNLLLNAKQAVPAGRTPRQEVALQCSPGKVLITIADNGSGIAEDVRDKVFRPNFTTKATGSGIGLAVAKRGIESAGGSIWFETVENEGTTFFIELPLAG
jgi:two-component system nitrogen regulation sensor histidine kinase NtrY